MKIFGAGMAGMLAGQYFRHMKPIIFEKQGTLPNNHSALLRFRTNVISDLTGIPFKQVKVTKAINFLGQQHSESNILFNNLYSHKVTGTYRSRSIMNNRDCVRYIAPTDFIQKLSHGLNIEYGCDVETMIFETNGPTISTLPVPTLAKMLDYNLDTILIKHPIWTLRFDLRMDCDLYQTMYFPNPTIDMYRLSITGRTVIAEFITEPADTESIKMISHHLEHDFGMLNYFPEEITIKKQRNGKLVECEDDQIKRTP